MNTPRGQLFIAGRFDIGDIVKISENGIYCGMREFKTHGTVVGAGRSHNTVRVLVYGRKSKQTYHASYLKLVGVADVSALHGEDK